MWYAYMGGDIMAMSQQEKTDYKRKYNEKKYSRIGLYLPPEEKEAWQAEADKQKIKFPTTRDGSDAAPCAKSW